MAEKKMSFEQMLERLEKIIKLLEKGEAPLTESLTLFEEGTALIKECTASLDTAEQRVLKLRKSETGEPEELPFDEE